MTEPRKWEEDDLQALIRQQAEEGLQLDFKRCGALGSSPKDGEKSKMGLSKHVSALANSAGGTIVYGMIERDHVADSLDDGYDPNVITREWIEQVITSNIQPRIAGVRVETVQLRKRNPGRVAYVVHVPQSSTAHQAKDNKYYRRHGSESVPMEHYEVVDVMNRRIGSDVAVEILIDGATSGTFTVEQIGEGQTVRTPDLHVFAVNGEGAAVAEYSSHRVYVQRGLDTLPVRIGSLAFEPSATTVIWQEQSLPFVAFDFPLSTDKPLFPGERRHLTSFCLTLPNAAHWLTPTPFVLWRSQGARGRAPAAGALVFDSALPGMWKFRPMSLGELEDTGFTAVFEP